MTSNSVLTLIALQTMTTTYRTTAIATATVTVTVVMVTDTGMGIMVEATPMLMRRGITAHMLTTMSTVHMAHTGTHMLRTIADVAVKSTATHTTTGMMRTCMLCSCMWPATCWAPWASLQAVCLACKFCIYVSGRVDWLGALELRDDYMLCLC